ncbi:sulfite oxidase-like isoform X1 [Zingiber officinale]|uniref:sulfite oxidase-like isoform X1 n=2 Tax=Zingiber officinale TaxID=94328 RepID=UPI001C4C4622|nr:sulfite oxidase-like isoform X1 [Zingiber officinale]
MPGLTAPSDYSKEPPRHPSLKINSKEPFNAEPHRTALLSYITPVDFFYKRNHGPIPIVNDIERYCVSIGGLVKNPLEISMSEIRKLPKYSVIATLQCAGNRRTEMSKTRKVRGVGWDVAAVGNAKWGGAKLADVLELVGISKNTSSSPLGGKHVEFISIDKCKEENGGPYKASIPLRQATNPEADVLLAYEMNGETLNRDHGYPLRVIVPGVIGARSVKWLDRISIIEEECQGFFMQKDYKMFPPSVNWDNINWLSRKAQMDFPVQSAICSLEDVDFVKPGKVTIAGYAVAGGGRGIERVDISVDGGRTWFEAQRCQRGNIPYQSDDLNNDKWAWVLFKAVVDVPESTVIIAKAVDTASNVQPENVEVVWNLRGILNTSWHKVQVRRASQVAISNL